MPKKIFIPTLIILLAVCDITNAQISKDAVPFSYKDKLVSVKDFIRMESFDAASMIKEDERSKSRGLKTKRFAKLFNVNLSPENSGKWDITNNGRVWRVGIISKNAYSIYLVFGNFKLNGNVNIFVYTSNYQKIKGAFTKKNNNIHNVLAVAPLPSDTIIIELNIPDEIKDYGKIILTRVGHDYRNAFGIHPMENENDPVPVGNCYVDINCPDGADWQSEKKAVCKILVGDELCTGSLIANRNEDKTPYFLTANHCVTDSSAVPGAIFYFNYEKPFCDSGLINQAQTLSGASIISTTDYSLDFTLLKLNDLPPVSYHPFFLGWDWSGAQPQKGTVIHHPNGAVKKISMDYSPLVQDISILMKVTTQQVFGKLLITMWEPLKLVLQVPLY